MRKHFVIAITLLAAAGSLGRAAELDLSKLPPASTKTGVTFATDIKPIFEASCVQCHGAQRPKGNLRLDSAEGALKGSSEGKVIVSGDSAKSKLVIAVSQLDPRMTMPPKPREGRRGPGGPGGGGPGGGGPGGGTPPAPAKPLTAEQVGLVRAWIDQGAK